MAKQSTYMMLKPDAFHHDLSDIILSMLKNAGLEIESALSVDVDIHVMKTLIDHYVGVIDSMDPTFDFPGKLFNSFYYHGPHRIMPMRVSYDGDEDIIEFTRRLVGATNPSKADRHTIRGSLSNDDYDKAGAENRLVRNLIHASDSHESAERELALWKDYL